jgi:predicted phosphodiesterase
LADSHGRVDTLVDGIGVLTERNVDKIIHLGDITDTLKPETVNECARILVKNRIDGVLGNHEYSFVAHHFKRYPEKFSDAAMEYVRSLPYILEISGICFTHFSPDGEVYGLYAATDQENYNTTLLNSKWPVLINGHSHDPRIYCQKEGKIENVKFDLDTPFTLQRDARYVLTCGALDDGWCAIFDAGHHAFEVISLDKPIP